MEPSLDHVRVHNSAVTCDGIDCPLAEGCWKAKSHAAPDIEGVARLTLHAPDTYGKRVSGLCDTRQTQPRLPKDWVKVVDSYEKHGRHAIDSGSPLMSCVWWFTHLVKIASDPDVPSLAANRAIEALRVLRRRMDQRSDWTK